MDSWFTFDSFINAVQSVKKQTTVGNNNKFRNTAMQIEQSMHFNCSSGVLSFCGDKKTNFTAITNVEVRNGREVGGERFVLFNSKGNLIMISFHWANKSVYPHVRRNSRAYSTISSIENFVHFKNNIGDKNEYKIEKVGQKIKVFVNGFLATEFTDNYFNGETQLGLATYGNAYYEDFCITSY